MMYIGIAFAFGVVCGSALVSFMVGRNKDLTREELQAEQSQC